MWAYRIFHLGISSNIDPLGRFMHEWSKKLNFLMEISIIEGNPQTLPQIRIDDIEAEGCLNVTTIICPNLRATL
jgi:hypothetical protein